MTRLVDLSPVVHFTRAVNQRGQGLEIGKESGNVWLERLELLSSPPKAGESVVHMVIRVECRRRRNSWPLVEWRTKTFFFP